MSGIVIFSFGSTIILTIFLVTLIEFILSHTRKEHTEETIKVDEDALKKEHEKAISDLKKDYEEKLKAATTEEKKEDKKEDSSEKETLVKKYEEKIAELSTGNSKALEKAKEKIKTMEDAAKVEIEEYMKNREEEVEDQLMDLVLSVTKKVLPAGLPYEIQKDLVLKSLQEVRSEEE